MAYVSKHHTEEERECDYGEHCWVDLLIHRYTIGIDYLLEGSCELIELDVGRRFDGVILISLDICCSKVPQLAFDPILISSWAPEVPYVSSIPMFHLVQRVVDRFLLCHKPLIHLKKTSAAIDIVYLALIAFSDETTRRDMVDRIEVVFELDSGSFVEHARVLNVASKILQLGLNVLDWWDLESLAHEGVTDAHDLLSHLFAFLEYHDVD